jgi:phytoene dehydrogenase-like protein
MTTTPEKTKASFDEKAVYDFIIVGSGLTGLSLAAGLSRAGHRVALLEAAETYGSSLREVDSPVGLVSNGLQWLAQTASSEEGLEFLKILLNYPSDWSVRQSANEVQTYDSRGFRAFVGFGSEAPENYEMLSYYLHQDSLQLGLSWKEILSALFSLFGGDFFAKSEVTKFNLQGNRAESVTVNGQKTLRGVHFIFTGPIKQLLKILPIDGLDYKSRQKITKAKLWTAIFLDLLHAHPPGEFPGLVLLDGTTKDVYGPAVGKLHSIQNLEGRQVQLSQWVSIVDAESAEDTEFTAAAIKKVKKQIQRAFPKALDGLLFERIVVSGSTMGRSELKLDGMSCLTEIKNISLASDSLHKEVGITGQLLQAKTLLNQLGVVFSEKKSPDQQPEVQI